MLRFREAVLGDPNQVAGSERNRPGFINLKPCGLVQGKQRGLNTLVLHPNTTLLILTGHRHPLAAPESHNVLMELDNHPALIISGIGALRFRPLQVPELKKLALIAS